MSYIITSDVSSVDLIEMSSTTGYFKKSKSQIVSCCRLLFIRSGIYF